MRLRDNKNKMKLLDQIICDSEGKRKKKILPTREHFTPFKPLIETSYNLKRNFYKIQINVGSYFFFPKDYYPLQSPVYLKFL